MNIRWLGNPATLRKQNRVDRFQGIDTIGPYEKLGKITDLGQAEALGTVENQFFTKSASPAFPDPTT